MSSQETTTHQTEPKFERTQLSQAIGNQGQEPETVTQVQQALKEQAQLLQEQQAAGVNSKQARSRIEGLIEGIRALVFRLVNAVRRLFSLPPLGQTDVAPNQEQPQFSFDADQAGAAAKQSTSPNRDRVTEGNVESQADGDLDSDKDVGDYHPDGAGQFSFAGPGDLKHADADSPDLAQQEYSLFTGNSPVASTLFKKGDGSFGMKSAYVGELNADAKQVMKQSLERLDATLNKVLADPKIAMSSEPAAKMINDLDMAAIHSSMQQCEKALVTDLVNRLQPPNQEKGTDPGPMGKRILKTAVEAIVTGLPLAAEETIKCTLNDQNMQERVREYLRENRPLIEEYLVNRSTVSALHQFAPQRQKVTETDVQLEQKAQQVLVRQEQIRTDILPDGKVSAEDLIALEESADLDLDENGLIRTARPAM